MSKVVHLSSAHPVTDPRIFHKECCALERAGYEVALIAPHESDEMKHGVRILGVARRRGRFYRFTVTGFRILRRALAEDAALYHFHDPDLIPFGLLLKLAGKRVVYDAHEEVPKQILSKPWIAPWLRGAVARAADWAERIAARALDGVVAATPAIARRFPGRRTVVVQNFPLPGELSNGLLPYSERPPLGVYAGNITVTRGIREMIGALARLPGEFRLALAGTFESAALEAECRAHASWSRLDALGFIGRSELANLLGRARVGLSVLHPQINYLESYPTKLFEYMAAGLPVVASNFPLWRTIVEGAGCGLLVDPLDPDDIARAIAWVLAHPVEAEEMGARGRKAVAEEYGWPAEEAKLLRFYRELA